MTAFTDRLRTARIEAGLSASELALWFDISKSTAASWIRGHVPHRFTQIHLEPMLKELERAARRKRPRAFPVPPGVRQKDRRDYVRRVRAQASF